MLKRVSQMLLTAALLIFRSPTKATSSTTVTSAIRGGVPSNRAFTCSEYCLSILTNGAWSLDRQFYINTDTIDIFEPLSIVNEIPANVHGEDASLLGRDLNL